MESDSVDKLINIVRNTIKKFNMIEAGDKVLVAVSGGADSICLLHVLYLLKDEYKINLYVAHVNHELRGHQADLDALFVKEVTELLKIKLFLQNINIRQIANKKSISEEVAGRMERYKFYFKTAKEIGANKIAVGQNLNDQAETLLMRIIRGTGLKGLAGIEPIRNDGVIRPLLEVDRQLIEQYCKDNRLEYRTDKTNLEPIYTRNKIRLQLIPQIIKEYNPNFIYSISNMADLLKEENNFIEEYADKLAKELLVIKKEGIYIKISKFTSLHKAIQRRLIRKAIYELKGNITDIEYKHINKTLKIISNNSGKKETRAAIELPQKTKLQIKGNYIHIFNNIIQEKEVGEFSYRLTLNGETPIKLPNIETNVQIKTRIIDKTKIKDIKKSNYIKLFDYDIINKEIYIRNRLAGDKFIPQGMEGRKKLKDYFIDLKVPKEKRDQIPIIATEDDIIWVIGYRTNAKYNYTENTKKVLVIEIIGGEKINDK